MMNMSGTGGYILHAFKMYAIPSLGTLYFRPDASPFAVSMIPTHKRYSSTVKRNVRSRNLLKFKRQQSRPARTP